MIDYDTRDNNFPLICDAINNTKVIRAIASERLTEDRKKQVAKR